MNGKSHGNKLNEVISTGRGKEKSCCIKVFLSQRNHWLSIPSYFICLDALSCWKKKMPFKMTLLWIWVSWFLPGSFTTSLVSQLIPSPVSEAPAAERAPAVESRPCSAPASLPRHVSGVWPHTQHHRAALTRLLQPALLPGVPTGGFRVPPAPGPGRSWLRRPWLPGATDSPPAPQAPAIAAAPVCQQKAKPGEERTAGLKQQWIKREGR